MTQIISDHKLANLLFRTSTNNSKNFDMKAPDKIYVSRPICNQCGTVISEDKPVEYLRNDTLMQWLESKIYEHNEDRFDDGFNAALGQVIDKINSL